MADRQQDNALQLLSPGSKLQEHKNILSGNRKKPMTEEEYATFYYTSNHFSLSACLPKLRFQSK